MKVELKTFSVLATLFSSLFFIIYYFNHTNMQRLVDLELKNSLKELQTNFDITTAYNKTDALSIHSFMSKNTKFLKLFYESKNMNEKEREKNRKTAIKMLSSQYQAMTKRGILQFQFIFPDNKSFLRMHKPNKYGDFLGDVRESIRNTNLTQTPSFGFEQGRTAHAFRNVFPLFYKNRYIGCYEISYTSESMQKNLTDVNQIHSHFLVKKDIFLSNTWKRKDLVLNYLPSIEDENFMFVITDSTEITKLQATEKILISKHKNEIKKNISQNKKFAIYQVFDTKAVIISFLPIHNTTGKKTLAYLVSYTDNSHIKESLNTELIINIISLISIGIILIMFYIQILQMRKIRTKSTEQEQLLSLFNKGSITLFRWNNDKNWSIDYVSNNVESLTGYTKEEFLSGKVLYSSLIDKRDIHRVEQEVLDAQNSNTTVFTHDIYRIITKNQSVKWLYDTSNIIKNSSGEITHFLGYIIDITSHKLLEIELQEMNNSLEIEVKKQTQESLNKDKIVQEQAKLAAMGEMVGAIAHQWRQPLNSLNINIQNLDDDYEENLINEIFLKDFISKQTQTITFMSKTIDDFRNFFRVDKLKKEFSVKDAITQTLNIQNAQLKNSNISFSIKGKDFKIYSLESEFHQTILNLISNAKDAIILNSIEHGKITIIIGSNTISVVDNAGGIEQKIADRIFEPYFTTKEQGKGTGMGLYLSKMIIERNIGGTLNFSNSENGSKFTITLDEII